MLLFGVTIPATVPQRSEFLERLMNYYVFYIKIEENLLQILISKPCCILSLFCRVDFLTVQEYESFLSSFDYDGLLF